MRYFKGDETLVISLCDYTGNWAWPWAKAGHSVLMYDTGVHEEDDITEMTIENFKVDIEDVDIQYNKVVVLAAPPCTHFSSSGARYWKEKDARGDTDKMLKVVDACYNIANELRADLFALENPVGRLPRLRPDMGKPCYYFDPYEYADRAFDPEKEEYTKKTGIWGWLNLLNERKPLVKPLTDRELESMVFNGIIGHKPVQGSWIIKLPPGPERQRVRSATPTGFANAFYETYSTIL